NPPGSFTEYAGLLVPFALRHSEYVVSESIGLITPSMEIWYQSSDAVSWFASALSHGERNTKPAVHVRATSGLSCELPASVSISNGKKPNWPAKPSGFWSNLDVPLPMMAEHSA